MKIEELEGHTAYGTMDAEATQMQASNAGHQGNSHPYRTPLELFESKALVKMCAPMVRYSKLAFRCLVRKYDCDLAFTPMIMSDSFVKSVKARNSEFTTNSIDRPLVVQFAANNAEDFADATEIVLPYSDGVDLNSGCPQKWALKEGIGASLINKPALIADMVQQAWARVDRSDFTVSVKIRIHHDIRETVEMCRRAEKMGASWVTVHGRTVEQRTDPVNIEAISIIKDALSIPVVANGDICSLADAEQVHAATGVDGVMAARGILANPAMYAGYRATPKACVQDWICTSIKLGTPFTYFHHHLAYMLDETCSRPQKRLLNCLGSTAAVIDFLREQLDISVPSGT